MAVPTLLYPPGPDSAAAAAAAAVPRRGALYAALGQSSGCRRPQYEPALSPVAGVALGARCPQCGVAANRCMGERAALTLEEP